MNTENKFIAVNDIQNLTNNCLHLLHFLDLLQGKGNATDAKKTAEEIFGHLRKLLIASIMHEKKLICVSGLQGTGKTTLMKTFYEIDDKFLNPTLGRGEEIPIVITEKKGLHSPTVQAKRVQKNSDGEIKLYEDRSISADKFFNAATGEDTKIIYLELFVPYKHTFNEGTSFLLLPGYETNKEYLNNLINFSVNSSDAAVFVFSHDKFADSDNEKHIKIIENKFGTNLVYVLSHSDASADDNAEFKKNCIETLKIPVGEADRVVCSGVYSDENKNAKWINEFKVALEKYAYGQTQHFHRNITYLYKEMEEIKDKLSQILVLLNEVDNTAMANAQIDSLLGAFDRACQKKRKELKKNLEEAFESAKNESHKRLEELFDTKQKLKGIKRVLFNSDVKDLAETRKKVEDALKYDNEEYIPNKYLNLAITQSLNQWEQIGRASEIGRLIRTKQENGKIVLLDKEEDSEGKNEALQNDVCILLSDVSQNKTNSVLKSSTPKKIMSAIVEATTYYYGIVSQDELAATNGLEYYEPAHTNLVPDNVCSGAKSSKKFIAGMAGMIGIDLIGDGTINMVAQIASSIGVAVPIAGAVAAAIIGAGAGSVVMRDLNRMQREDFMSAKATIDNIYDNVRDDALEKYDNYMEKIRDRIEDNIIDINGVERNAVDLLNAKIEVNNILNQLNELLDKYRKDVYGLIAAF